MAAAAMIPPVPYEVEGKRKPYVRQFTDAELAERKKKKARRQAKKSRKRNR